jgi:hypothetical protein
VPTCRQRLREYFPACPVCGGRTGVDAWHGALHAAVKALGMSGSTAEWSSQGPLAVLVAQSYRPGQRLSDWLATRPGV